MDFVAPQIVEGEIEVEIGEEYIISQILYWQSALIMYAIGSELNMNAVKGFMMKHWNFVKLSEIKYSIGDTMMKGTLSFDSIIYRKRKLC